jgi:hypothetical protein
MLTLPGPPRWFRSVVAVRSLVTGTISGRFADGQAAFFGSPLLHVGSLRSSARGLEVHAGERIEVRALLG